MTVLKASSHCAETSTSSGLCETSNANIRDLRLLLSFFFSLVSHSLVLHLSERFEGWLSNLSPSPETFGESCSAESEGTELRKLKY